MQPGNLQSCLDATPKVAHFVGIGGCGMQALASILSRLGWEISGSDMQPQTVRELAPLAATIKIGHSARHVPGDTTLLIYSDAIPESNPERAYAAHLAIPSFNYASILGKLTQHQRTIAVAGTHGKSTATAMTAEILVRAELDPTVVCGAVPREQADQSASFSAIGRFGGRHGHGQLAIVEACEYRENFLRLTPSVAVVLNVERDHFDYFSTRSQLIGAFEKFIRRTPANGLLIVSADCADAKSLASSADRQVATFGLARDADFTAVNLEHTRGRYRFDLVNHGKRLSRIGLSVAGRHNVANALAAAAVARNLGVSAHHIAQGLSAFRGLRRRLDARWTIDGVTWVDDYAHHPTEVAATLASLREMFPQRRICCVFQPHQASRLTALLDEFAASLHNADRIAIAEVCRAREPEPQCGEATAADLAERLRAQGADVLDEYRPVAIVERLAEELRPGDVLATLGAGDLGKHFYKFHERLRSNCAAA